jgi:Cft2 family RNA processing exonuclease/dsRNA-specific ribonuclease
MFMTSTSSMEIKFLGGASSIGASCTLVRAAGATFVVDGGMRYSGSSPLPDLSSLADVRVDAVLMTHAHTDHSGGLPVLAEACPAAPVFATPPTIDLIGILLRDSLRLMNSPERESEVPLYTEQQVDHLLHSLVPVKFHQPIQVGEIEIRWLPASHILGAAMILMKTPSGTVLFTGDYSVAAQQTVPALARPDFQADLVISESTYGERLHEDRNAAEGRLLGQIGEAIDRGGRVLIPAFAVGRAQEVLLILKHAFRNGTLPETPVFVDGMVRAVCDVYRSHEPFVSRSLAHEIRRAPHAFYTDAIQAVTRAEDRARVLDTSPCVIVASSGMLAGGPSAGYCQELAKNAKDAVLLTGYQDEESPGRALLDLARVEGPRLLRIGQAAVPVACTFGTYGLSAHADRMQMVSFIEAACPRTVVLVHGDEAAKQALGRSLQCRDVVIARDGMTLERAYSPRSSTQRRPSVPVPSADNLDIERARHLLGPASGTTLRAGDVAEAWFGREVDRTTAEHFARVLESVGLVRRDDHRRDRLWVQGVGDSKLFPEEAELEEQLKRENPKGRLLEFCGRTGTEPPVARMEKQGAFYCAAISLHYQGRCIESGPFQAASKKTAEQMAARALLELIAGDEPATDTRRVTDDDAIRLQQANPKGRLLEWCAKCRVAPPAFERDSAADGYRIRAVITLAGQTTLAAGWFVSPKLKIAEQAAAESLLGQLPDAPHSGSLPATPAAAPSIAGVPSPPVVQNPLVALNELVQAGLLKSSGNELLGQSGPSHQPRFSVVAWAVFSDGTTIRGEPVEGPSKKSAQTAAAGSLLEVLVERGITRRNHESA